MKKTLVPICFACIILFLFCEQNQKPNWISFTSSKPITALASDDEYMWAGTSHGLVRIDNESGEPIFYNKSNSGISNNNVKSITVDTDGNKWIIVEDCLVKFDGDIWTKYCTSNSDLPVHNLYCLEIDKDGNIWIGTYNSIIKFDGVNWTTFKTPNYRDGFDNIWSISIDSKNNKWIVTGRGLLRFNGNEWAKFSYSNPDFPVSAIDKLDNIWLGTPDGLTKFDGEKWDIYNTTKSKLADNNILSIAIDKNDNKILRTISGLTKFNGKDFISLKGLILEGMANNSDLLTIDSENNIWVSKGNKLERFDGTNWKRFKTSESNYPFSRIYSIGIDSKGNKWIASDSLTKFNGKNWQSGTYIPNRRIYSRRNLTIDKNDNIWFDAVGSVLKFDGKYWTVYDSSNSCLTEKHISESLKFYKDGKKIDYMEDTMVNDIAAEDNGTVWIATSGSELIKFDGANWTNFNISNSNYPGGSITAILIDGIGNKWLGMENNRLAKFDDSVFVTYNIPEDSRLHHLAYSKCLAIDKKNYLWIAVNQPASCMPWDIESILYKFDGKDWSSYSSDNSKFPSQSSVSAIICDEENNLWIGTGSGLVKFDGVEWIIYNSRNSGLLNDDITSILIDEYDNKWIGTLDGLAVFNEGGVILEKEFLNP